MSRRSLAKHPRRPAAEATAKVITDAVLSALGDADTRAVATILHALYWSAGVVAGAVGTAAVSPDEYAQLQAAARDGWDAGVEEGVRSFERRGASER